MIKKIALATAVVAVLTSGAASAELAANAGIFSNYIWRGVTQTDDSAAGQGGIDWGHDSGLYAGTWVSTLGSGNGYEIDFYGGFAGEAGSFGYDLGAITYQYPTGPSANFTEIYASGTFNVLTVSLNYTVDAASGNDAEKDTTASGAFESGDLYVYGALDFPTKAGDLSFYAGSYMFDQDGKDYSPTGATVGNIDYVHYGASWSKNGFALAVDKNDIDDTNGAFGAGDGTADNVRVTVSYSKDFDLL